MKSKNLIYADLIAIILTLLSISLSFTKFNSLVNTTYYIYMMAYLACLFINMDNKKPYYILIPIFFYSVIITFIFNGFSLFNNREILKDFIKIIYGNFDIIFLGLIFYIIERIFTKIFGAYFSTALGLLSILIYFVDKYLYSFTYDDKLQNYFLYFFVFIIFSNLRPASMVKKYLYLIASLIFLIELLIIDRFNIFIGFHISWIILIYLVLKREVKIEKAFAEKYFLFCLILVLPMIKYIMDYLFKLKYLPLMISSIIICFFLSVILFETRFKIVDYLILGIHNYNKKRG